MTQVAGFPVTMQPGVNYEMLYPTTVSIPGCPPGLEYLAQIDQVVIKQEVSLLEVLADFECPNKYRMFNSMGQQIYYIFEESDCCDRYWCGPMRGFIFHITDNNQQEVARLVRRMYICKGCYCCACESCRYFATVEDRTGNVIGYISDMYFCCSPRLAIYDNRKEFVAEINGPCCPCQAVCCTDDIDFPITDVRDGKYWGKITKQWSGLLKEALTDADNYSVTFPIDLDVNKKMLMIAAAFYTDMVVFETQKNNNN